MPRACAELPLPQHCLQAEPTWKKSSVSPCLAAQEGVRSKVLTPLQCTKDEGTVQEAAETLAGHVRLNTLSFLMYNLKLGILTLVWTLAHAEPVPAAGSPCRSRGHSVKICGPGWELVAPGLWLAPLWLTGFSKCWTSLSQPKLQVEHGTGWRSPGCTPWLGMSPKSSVVFP